MNQNQEDSPLPDDRHIPGLALPRALLRIVGIACITLAALSLLYTLSTAVSVLIGFEQDPQTPYLLHFFGSFALIVIVLQVLLLFCGHQLIKLRTNARGLLLAICVATVLVMFGSGCLWTMADRRVALSAAAATGIGLGGLSLHILSAFPIWAPAVTYWAHRRLSGARRERKEKGLCQMCGYDLQGATHRRCPECGCVVETASDVAQ